MAMNKKITFQKLPQTVEELKSLPQAALSDPFDTAALFVAVMAEYSENRTAAEDMIGFLKGVPMNNYKKQFVADRMEGKAYLPFSYMDGAAPENGYAPSMPYTVTVSDNPYSNDSPGYSKLYVRSSGADSPRPIILQKNGNVWNLSDEMILADIRKPAMR